MNFYLFVFTLSHIKFGFWEFWSLPRWESRALSPAWRDEMIHFGLMICLFKKVFSFGSCHGRIMNMLLSWLWICFFCHKSEFNAVSCSAFLSSVPKFSFAFTSYLGCSMWLAYNGSWYSRILVDLFNCGILPQSVVPFHVSFISNVCTVEGVGIFWKWFLYL